MQILAKYMLRLGDPKVWGKASSTLKSWRGNLSPFPWYYDSSDDMLVQLQLPQPLEHKIFATLKLTFGIIYIRGKISQLLCVQVFWLFKQKPDFNLIV